MEITGKYAASNFFVQQGVVVDLARKCYRKFNRLFRFLTFRERCMALPRVDYVLLFKTLYAKCEACSLEDFETSATIQLSLVHHRNRRLIIHESKNLEEMMALAGRLAKELHVKIRDSASDRRNPKWLRAADINPARS